MRFVIALLCCLVVTFSSPVPSSKPPPPPSDHVLDYDRVHFLDHSPETRAWVFRGNMPKNTTLTFGYDQLLEFLSKRAAEENLEFPADISLFVISLNSLYNQADTDIEQAFFDQHPELGVFENWSLYHRYANPFTMSEDDVRKQLEDPELWGKDDIPNRVERLGELFATKTEKDVVYYFHCETGCDRTGEIGAAYLMRYFNQTRQEVDVINKVDCGRDANPSAEYAIGWYCFYLEYKLGLSPQCNYSAPVDYSSIIYTAAFLPDESRSTIASSFPPHLVNKFIDHMTIVYKPQPFQIETLPWGREVELTVLGYGNDGQAEALVVQSSVDLHSTNPITHITISTAEGVGAQYSNDMLAKGYEKIENGLVVKAKVGAFLKDKGVVYHL